jgi:hypothetical protein
MTKTITQAFDEGLHSYIYGKRIQIDSTIYDTVELRQAFSRGFYIKRSLELINRNSIVGAYRPKDQSTIFPPVSSTTR